MACGSLRKVPQENLAVSKPVWWLECRFHFAFADYYNPENINFGALRVLNDDLVKPGGSFGRHLHRDAEILVYVVKGELSHRPDGAQWQPMGPGGLLHMTAGTGLMHEEANQGEETLRYLQVWLTPDRKGRPPKYGSSLFALEGQQDSLLHVAQADANVFISRCTAGNAFELRLGAGRQAYVVCIEGLMDVSGTQLGQRDALEVQAPSAEEFPFSLSARGTEGAHFMMVEMAREEDDHIQPNARKDSAEGPMAESHRRFKELRL